MKRNINILLTTEISIFIVVTIVMFFTIAWIEPVTPIRHTCRIVLPFLLIAYFFLFIAFRILSYYYYQLLHQKHIIEKLNTSFINLHSKVKMDELLKQSMEIFMDFCRGDKSIMWIIDEKIKEYASKDILSINTNVQPEDKNPTIEKESHRLLTFFPSHIPQEIDKDIKELLKKYDFVRYRNIIVIPISNNGKIKAVCIVGVPEESKKESGKILEDMKDVMDILLRKLQIEIESSILHEEINKASITDPLTNLYNRRYFNKRVQEEFAKAKRVGFPVSIMISDLDDFKNYVDTYGHPKGDIILSEIASVVKGTLRETDIVCRFGGDEFAYLLPFASSVEGNTLAERIKKNVSQSAFLKNDVEQPVHITMSIGIASFPEHGKDEQEILNKADHALFAAKDKGKNRIYIHTEDKA
jgi:diguanylate cyclase (GGDEF)-like protein